nr:peroxisome biogenesis protein 6-like [Malus domestica]
MYQKVSWGTGIRYHPLSKFEVSVQLQHRLRYIFHVHKCVVLLSTDSLAAGCGKRTVVRYISRRLGLHVVECHNLMASSEKRMSVSLAQTLNTAQRYSPAILLLRHFYVFRNLGSHEGSPSDQVGITSEVASLIREFTEPISDDGDMDSEEKHNGDIVRCNCFSSTYLGLGILS